MVELVPASYGNDESYNLYRKLGMDFGIIGYYGSFVRHS